MPPSDRGGFDPAHNVARLKAVADEAERDMATLSISVFGAPADAAELARCRDAGIDRAILALPSADADTLLPLLDRRAALVEEV